MAQQSKSVKSSPKTAKSKSAAKERRAEEKAHAEIIRRGRKTGIILGVVLAILILIGIGFFVWYLVCYSQPSRVALDAVDDLITSNDIMLDGQISVTPEATDSEVQEITLRFNSSANQAPSTSSIELKVLYRNGDIINFELGTILLQDGAAYLRIGGIMDALNTAGVDEQLRVYAYVVYSALELIDNEWWQISVPDLIAGLELPSEDAKKLDSIYDCVVSTVQKNQSSDIIAFYRKNSFISLERVKEGLGGEVAAKGSKYYRAAINYDNLAKFINFLPETPVAESVYSCVNDNIAGANLSASDINEISAKDLKEVLPLNSEVYLEISNWQHRLKSVTAQIIDDDYTVDIDFTIQHGAIAINLPESYRPISDLVDEISELFSMFFVEPVIEAGEMEYIWD